MNLKTTKIYQNVEALFKYKDLTIICDYLGLHFFDKDEKEIAFINDFFDGSDGKIFNDHFLILRNTKYGFKIYDLEKKEFVSNLKMIDDKMVSEEGYEIVGDKLYAISGSMSSRLSNLFKNEEGEVERIITIYSLPTFEIINEIKTMQNFLSINYIPLYDTFYLVDDECNLYSLKENELIHVDRFNFEIFGILCNMERKEVYLVTLLGIRVYDSKFNEINKFDFVNDDEMDSDYTSLFPVELPRSLKKSNRESIVFLDLLSKDYVIMLASLYSARVFELAVFSLVNGKKVYSLEVPNPIDPICVINEKTITMYLKRNLFTMEIEYDK